MYARRGAVSVAQSLFQPRNLLSQFPDLGVILPLHGMSELEHRKI